MLKLADRVGGLAVHFENDYTNPKIDQGNAKKVSPRWFPPKNTVNNGKTIPFSLGIFSLLG
jgi:hypothetical protein